MRFDSISLRLVIKNLKKQGCFFLKNDLPSNFFSKSQHPKILNDAKTNTAIAVCPLKQKIVPNVTEIANLTKKGQYIKKS